MIMREHGPLFADGILEDVCIGNALAGPPCLLNRPHVVSASAKLLDDRQGKVLIGI
jgi:hypothetical protein